MLLAIFRAVVWRFVIPRPAVAQQKRCDEHNEQCDSTDYVSQFDAPLQPITRNQPDSTSKSSGTCKCLVQVTDDSDQDAEDESGNKCGCILSEQPADCLKAVVHRSSPNKLVDAQARILALACAPSPRPTRGWRKWRGYAHYMCVMALSIACILFAAFWVALNDTYRQRRGPTLPDTAASPPADLALDWPTR